MQGSFEQEHFKGRRRKAIIASGLFLVVHLLYTIFQVVTLAVIGLPDYIVGSVFQVSIVVNIVLDVVTFGFLLLALWSPRSGQAGDRLVIIGATVCTIFLLLGWVIQLHFGGSQSSHILALILGTLVVVAWFLPWRVVLGLTGLTTLLIIILVAMEVTEVLAYSPLLLWGRDLGGLYGNWPVIGMNAIIYACIFTAVMWITLRLKSSLEKSQRALQLKNRELHAEIQERVRAQRTLRQAVEQLHSFIRGTTHDLRSPLTAIGGFTDLLERGLEGKEKDRNLKRIKRIQDGVQQMEKLLSDLSDLVLTNAGGLELSRLESGDVLARVLGLFEERLKEADAQVHVERLPVVMADKGLLSRVFQNLLDNALKFRGKASLEIHIDAVARDDRWEIRVADNGRGMDADMNEDAFEPFERRGDQEGHGIGLSVCRHALELMSGDIWYENRPEGGTVFCFTLNTAD